MAVSAPPPRAPARGRAQLRTRQFAASATPRVRPAQPTRRLTPDSPAWCKCTSVQASPPKTTLACSRVVSHPTAPSELLPRSRKSPTATPQYSTGAHPGKANTRGTTRHWHRVGLPAHRLCVSGHVPPACTHPWGDPPTLPTHSESPSDKPAWHRRVFPRQPPSTSTGWFQGKRKAALLDPTEDGGQLIQAKPGDLRVNTLP